MKKYLKHSAKGFGLIEIMISVVILFTVLMIVPTVLMKHTQNTTSNRLANEVTSIGQGIINDMRKSAKTEPDTSQTRYPSYDQMVPEDWYTNGLSQIVDFTYFDMQGVQKTIQLERSLNIEERGNLKRVVLELSDTHTPSRFRPVKLRASIIKPSIMDNRINPGMNYVWGNVTDQDTGDPIDGQIISSVRMAGQHTTDTKNGYYQTPYYPRKLTWGKNQTNQPNYIILRFTPLPVFNIVNNTTHYYYGYTSPTEPGERIIIDRDDPIPHHIALKRIITGDAAIRILNLNTNLPIEKAWVFFSYKDIDDGGFVTRTGYTDADGVVILYGLPVGSGYTIQISSYVRTPEASNNVGYYGNVIENIAINEGSHTDNATYNGFLEPITKTQLIVRVIDEDNSQPIPGAEVNLYYARRTTDNLGECLYVYGINKDADSYTVPSHTFKVEAGGYKNHQKTLSLTLNREQTHTHTVRMEQAIAGFAVYAVEYNSTDRKWDIIRDTNGLPQNTFTKTNPSNNFFYYYFAAFYNSELLNSWVIQPGNPDWTNIELSTNSYNMTGQLSLMNINDSDDIITAMHCQPRGSTSGVYPWRVHNLEAYRYLTYVKQNESGTITFTVRASTEIAGATHIAERHITWNVIQPEWDPNLTLHVSISASKNPVRERDFTNLTAVVRYPGSTGQIITNNAIISSNPDAFSWWIDGESHPLNEIAVMTYSSKAVRRLDINDTNHITTSKTAKASVSASLNTLTGSATTSFTIEPYTPDMDISCEILTDLSVAPGSMLEIDYILRADGVEILRRGYRATGVTVRWTIEDENDIQNGHYFQLATSCPTRFYASNTLNGDNLVNVTLSVSYGARYADFRRTIVIRLGGIGGTDY